MSSWPLIQSRWIDDILFHDGKIGKRSYRKHLSFILGRNIIDRTHGICEKKDCPSTQDNTCKALKTMFCGNTPCDLLLWCKKGSDFMESLFRAVSFQSLSERSIPSQNKFQNIPPLMETETDMILLSCLSKKCLSLWTSQKAKTKCIFPITQTFPLAFTCNPYTRFVIAMTKACLGLVILGRGKGEEVWKNLWNTQLLRKIYAPKSQ